MCPPPAKALLYKVLYRLNFIPDNIQDRRTPSSENLAEVEYLTEDEEEIG